MGMNRWKEARLSAEQEIGRGGSFWMTAQCRFTAALAGLGLCLLAPGGASASGLAVPNAFTANTTAVAEEVNQNFDAVEAAVDDNDGRIIMLTGTVSQLSASLNAASDEISELRSLVDQLTSRLEAAESGIADVQTSPALALGSFVRIEPSPIEDLAGPHILFEGANVHVRSGSGNTADEIEGEVDLQGLGNLIVGYNEQGSIAGIPQPRARGGSHNLIVGPGHGYTSSGGLVAGSNNRVNAEAGSVTGGVSNTVSGHASSIAGGDRNSASGAATSIAGGLLNRADSSYSMVCGGQSNFANGFGATVSGGFQGRASGNSSTVSGGGNATEDHKWIGGGVFENF